MLSIQLTLLLSVAAPCHEPPGASVAAPLVRTQPGPSASSPRSSEEGLECEVTYLANEGFLIETEILKVVIDGFVKKPFREYAALTEEAVRALTKAEPPFDGRILSLVSHGHRDHFQPRLAARFLGASKGAALVSSPQVLAGLQQAVGDDDEAGVLSKLFPITLAPGESETFDMAPADASIRFTNLPHAGDPKGEILNYAHLIRIGDLKILHLGDADAKRAHFEDLGLASQGIDVAFIPSWFFASAEGTAIIDELIQPRVQVACHIPPSDLAMFARRMEESNPHVVVFEQAMESKTFTAGAIDR